ncbi:hypothetical protein ACOME3_000832 [Neoechinorhynchus agilis]
MNKFDIKAGTKFIAFKQNSAMSIQLFLLSFLVGLLVCEDEIPSGKCIIEELSQNHTKIQCGSNNINATTLIGALNSIANQSVSSLSIAGVGFDEIPTNLSDILTKVTTLIFESPPSREYQMCTEMLRNIEKLELNYMKISEMKFIQEHPKLKDLQIAGGEMAQLDQSFENKLPKLEILSIGMSPLSSLEVIKKMCSLRQLILHQNKITSLDIDNATCFQNLTVLDLYGNAIRSVAIDPQAVPKLESLRIDYNGDLNQLIKSLDLPNLIGLTVRETNSTIFNVANLKNLSKLNSLYLEDGTLERVPIGNQQTNANILILNLANNNISTVNGSDFEGWTNLLELYLNHNKIKELSENSFSKLTKLRVLDLQNNNISQRYNNTFLGLPNTTQVNLDGNPITTIPPSTTTEPK